MTGIAPTLQETANYRRGEPAYAPCSWEGARRWCWAVLCDRPYGVLRFYIVGARLCAIDSN